MEYRFNESPTGVYTVQQRETKVNLFLPHYNNIRNENGECDIELLWKDVTPNVQFTDQEKAIEYVLKLKGAVL